MKRSILGRTNREFPKVWLRLEISAGNSRREDLVRYVARAATLQLPLDISVSPALFGGIFENVGDLTLVQVSSLDFEIATDAKHAADLVQAHLIETLSCIGRPYIDFYFLRFRQTLEEAQLAGIMEALESARQENHIRYFGLHAESIGAALGNWQFHNAFDVISIPDTFTQEDRDTLRRMAHQRRTGFILRSDRKSPRADSQEFQLLSVASLDDLLALGDVA